MVAENRLEWLADAPTETNARTLVFFLANGGERELCVVCYLSLSRTIPTLCGSIESVEDETMRFASNQASLLLREKGTRRIVMTATRETLAAAAAVEKNLSQWHNRPSDSHYWCRNTKSLGMQRHNTSYSVCHGETLAVLESNRRFEAWQNTALVVAVPIPLSRARQYCDGRDYSLFQRLVVQRFALSTTTGPSFIVSPCQ